MRKNKKAKRKAILILIIILIFIVTVVIGFFFWAAKKNHDLANKQNSNNEACKSHVYQGDTEIEAWYLNKDNHNFIQTRKDQLANLPSNETVNNLNRSDKDLEINMVDMTPDIIETLQNSSKDNPHKVHITGFATDCQGEMFASLEYKDGIFRSSLSQQ